MTVRIHSPIDRVMSRLLVRSAVHAASALHHVYVLWFATGLVGSAAASGLQHHHRIAVAVKYGARYLTIWNFLFQTIFLMLSVWCDLAEWLRWKPTVTLARVRYCREMVYHALVFPFTLYVTGIFWALYSLDRELVYPRVLDLMVPIWYNHSVHSSILVVLLLESVLVPRGSPDLHHRKVFFVAVNLYSLVYHYTYFMDGVWLYPFYELMSWPQRFLWQLQFWLFLYILYKAQWPILGSLQATVYLKRCDSKKVDSSNYELQNGAQHNNSEVDMHS